MRRIRNRTWIRIRNEHKCSTCLDLFPWISVVTSFLKFWNPSIISWVTAILPFFTFEILSFSSHFMAEFYTIMGANSNFHLQVFYVLFKFGWSKLIVKYLKISAVHVAFRNDIDYLKSWKFWLFFFKYKTRQFRNCTL